MIVRENYKKFIDVSNSCVYRDGEQSINFSLEGLAKCIDIAYLEGKLSVLTSTPDYENDDSIMEEVDQIQQRLSELIVFSEFEVDDEKTDVVSEEKNNISNQEDEEEVVIINA